MKLRAFAQTDIGCLRSENEDSLLCDEALGVYAVADGIGGLPGGAKASQCALATLGKWFHENRANPLPDYADALLQANRAVFLLGEKISPRHGIGTTLTLVHFCGNAVALVHVGDSSCFRLRGSALDALTIDHNVENEMKARAARGEKVFAMGENRAALTRCVGQPPPLEGDVSRHPVQCGDRYLVCTDGITRSITPRELAGQLAAAASPADAVAVLLNVARQRGGLDNATAVVVFVD